MLSAAMAAAPVLNPSPRSIIAPRADRTSTLVTDVDQEYFVKRCSSYFNNVVISDYLGEKLSDKALRSHSDARHFLNKGIEGNVMNDPIIYDYPLQRDIIPIFHEDFNGYLERCANDGAVVGITSKLLQSIVNSEISRLLSTTYPMTQSPIVDGDTGAMKDTQIVESLNIQLMETLRLKYGNFVDLLTSTNQSLQQALPFYHNSRLQGFLRRRNPAVVINVPYCVVDPEGISRLIQQWELLIHLFGSNTDNTIVHIISYLNEVISVIRQLLDPCWSEFLSSNSYKKLFFEKDGPASPVGYCKFMLGGNYYYTATALTSGYYRRNEEGLICHYNGSRATKDRKAVIYIPSFPIIIQQISSKLYLSEN